MTEPTYLLRDLLLPELTLELAKTRKALERAPEDQGAFKPHERSTALLDLCNHLTTVSGIAGTILREDGLVMGGPEDPRRIVKEATAAGRLAAFDEMVAGTLEALKGSEDARFTARWEASRGGNVVFSGTRYAALRQMGINHMVHHRAQLGTYLRLLDVPVPATFGPSADEK